MKKVYETPLVCKLNYMKIYNFKEILTRDIHMGEQHCFHVPRVIKLES